MTQPTKAKGGIGAILAGTGDRIAVTRTLAPAVWAALVSTALGFGVDIHGDIAGLDGAGGLEPIHVATYGPLILFGVLYLVGKFSPGVLESIILLIPVERTGYITKQDVAGGDSRHVAVNLEVVPNGEIDPSDILNDTL